MNQIIEEKINAEVIAVYPDKVKISVDDLDDFQIAEEKLKVGSYLRIADNDNAVLIAVIENFMIEVPTVLDNIVKKKYIIEAAPLGIIRGEKFERGGDTLTIPPKEVLPAREEEIKSIFEHSISKQKQFCFSVLSTNHNISVPVDGNKFFSKHIAIVGSTGSGKSTLINLVPRFYEVSEGSIKVAGVDVREMTQHELRDRIGLVPQKGNLFSGTIRSNLKYGAPEATDEELEEVIRVAQAKEFIDQKEERFDMEISQGGTNVSGGQKQRLAIARAIAKNPDIYIFDDSFSALDLKTDAALRGALSENVTDSTIVIVAQRISTILHAEQILVLDEGRIVGKGTHEELLEHCEVYRQIAESQLSASELGMEESEVTMHE